MSENLLNENDSTEELLSENIMDDQPIDVESVIDDRESKMAYVWDRKTLFFVGTVSADPDQMDLKNWIKPFNSSFDEPPKVEENQAVVRDVESNEWIVKADFRGAEYWNEDGKKHTITELDEEVPEGALLEAPIIPPTLKEQTAIANAECSKRINKHWNQIGQINASLGVYGEGDTSNCVAWISSNRAALVALLAREDLIKIDVTDDQYWPVFEGAN